MLCILRSFEERRLASEVEALLRQADAVDEAEDARLGAEVRGRDRPTDDGRGSGAAKP